MDDPTFITDPDLIESPLLRQIFDTLGKRANPRLLARAARRLEGGDMRSRTLRRILWHRYGVQAHAFSYGGFHEPGASEPGLSVGRFASVSRDARWGLGHPMDHVSLSHFFADPRNGFVERWPFERPTLEIGPDAWIGALAVITSGCSRIGIGAVVGAGAVVTRDVPDFGVVVGVPAKLVRLRFSEPLRDAILASRWWERSPQALRGVKVAFTEPVGEAGCLEALARLRDGDIREPSS
jgi:acetyltransferase-like isoleucine patch superfamily enzyme